MSTNLRVYSGHATLGTRTRGGRVTSSTVAVWSSSSRRGAALVAGGVRSGGGGSGGSGTAAAAARSVRGGVRGAAVSQSRFARRCTRPTHDLRRRHPARNRPFPECLAEFQNTSATVNARIMSGPSTKAAPGIIRFFYCPLRSSFISFGEDFCPPFNDAKARRHNFWKRAKAAKHGNLQLTSAPPVLSLAVFLT